MNINDILKKILEIPDLVTNKHTHNNKSVLDKITQSLLDNWNSAYSHISDSVKHITGAERTTWNTVTNKVDKISGKGLSANDYTTEEKNKLSGIANNANNYVHPATHNASMIVEDATHRFVSDTEKTGWNDKYSKNEIDNKINQVITDLDWKESVATYSALSTTYPSPQDGWTVNVKDTDITYRWSGSKWISISANAIPLATSSVDGKMSKSDKAKLDGIASNAQVNTITGVKGDSESNYRVGNVNITKANIGLGNVDNTSDANKPISTATQTALNGKANSSHTHTKSQITDIPTKLSQFSNDAGYITQADVDTSQNHTHANKTTLDKITESNLTDWNNKLSKSGGSMSGTISWDGLTANKDLLYATGSTDWAKIQYIINSSDNCELRNQIGDDTTTKFTWYGNNTKLMDLQPTGNGTTISGANLSINGNITATNFNGTVNGFTLGKTVPANAVFTDTNTWRGVQDNLTSTATDQSLSANQGKVLKDLVDGKANSSHTHNYAGSSSAGGSANTAVKLATARTIALTGSVTGSVSFDGSGNVSMTTSEGNISFKQLGEVGNTTNWNTLTTAGCYKVQMSAWGASATYYSPNQYSSSIYNYGLLLVFKSAVSSEDRTVQIYIPHKDTTDTSSLIVTRMLNGTTWNSWKPIFKGITKANIGLGNVDNTSDLNKPISTATQNALNGKANSSHNHDDRYYTETEADSKFATKSEISRAGYGDMLKSVYDTNNNGVVDRTEKLYTARKINGVNFDGSGDITINAIPSGKTIDGNFISNFRNQVKGDTNPGDFLASIRNDTANVDSSPQFGSGIGFGRGDTHGYLYMNYSSADAFIGAGNAGKLNWTKQLAFLDSNVASATKATQDSDGKQINTTYVKKGMTWNQLEGV